MLAANVDAVTSLSITEVAADDWDTAATVLYTVYGSAGSGSVATVTYESGSLLSEHGVGGTPVPTTIARGNTTARSAITLIDHAFNSNYFTAAPPFRSE